MRCPLRLTLLSAIALLLTMTGWTAEVPREIKSDVPPVGIVVHPCPPLIPRPAAVRDLLVELFIEPRKLTRTDLDRLLSDEQFKRFNQEIRSQALQDWPGLCRYRAANESLLAAGASPRVVFLGDSITENWAIADPKLFEGDVANRGISGQTTPQMLVRFRADVITLKPQIVHILAGTNDVAGNTGPTSPQDFRDNIMSMAELARANGIFVVLASIPPAAAFSWRPGLDPVPRIRELNVWLRDYATRNGFDYIDYYTALAGASGELRSELSNDGVHPNGRGYRIMRELVEKKLAERSH